MIEGLARLKLLEFGVKCHGDLRLGWNFQLSAPFLGAPAQRAPVHRPVDARADRADEPGCEEKPDEQHPIGAVLAGKLGGNVLGDLRAGRLADIGPPVIHEVHRGTATLHLGKLKQHRPQHEQHQDGDDCQPDGGQSGHCSHDRGGKLQLSRIFEPSLVISL